MNDTIFWSFVVLAAGWVYYYVDLHVSRKLVQWNGDRKMAEAQAEKDERCRLQMEAIERGN